MGSVIYDIHGTVIATVGAVDDARRPTSSDSNFDVSPFMWQAVVASEDRRFFEHRGIDPRGLSRAALSLSLSGGGSTITQQLVKNLFLTNERKWTRKLIEMFLAVLLENRMSKWDILHTYLKKIYWGHGIYGIEAASAFYFGKHPSMLRLGECAMLAGIIPAPEILSPYRDPSRGKKPQARTLRRMVEVGFLDTSAAEAAVNEPLHVGVGGQHGIPGPWKAPFFVSEVLYELKQKFGCDRVFEGGLQVYTTLDLGMQEIAEKAVRDGVMDYDAERVSLAEKGIQKISEKLNDIQKVCELDIEKAIISVMSRDGLKNDSASVLAEEAVTKILKKFSARKRALQTSLQHYEQELKRAVGDRLEAAMVAIHPSNGAVRVLIGGRDYIESSFNRCTEAFRPPGSTFQPVVYLTALAAGIDRRHILVDEPYTVANFSPENFDKNYRGRVTVEESLLRSLNVPTVKLCAKVGVEKVGRMGRILGIEAPLPRDLTLALGGFEVTPLQLATVYSTIAAGGIYHKPYLIDRVETKGGQILHEEKHSIDKQKVIVDEHAILEIRKLLQGVIQRGTGRAARIGRPCAGKTGTSDGHRDVWFAGFTPDLTCVVWLGYDDNSPVGGLHPGTGSSHAAPVWTRFMKSIYEDQPIKYFHDNNVQKNGMGLSRKSSRMRRKHYRLRNLQIKRKILRSMDIRTVWRDVWDWENASSVWEEREKMVEWTAKHMKTTAEMKALQTAWRRKLR